MCYVVAIIANVVYNCGMNQQNFDKKMTDIIQSFTGVPRLLLHVCCAPCATYCLTQLITHFDVTLYYSNDNITDNAEWNKRLEQLRKLVDIVNNGQFVVNPTVPVKLVVPSYNTDNFFAVAQGLEQEPEGGARCKQCFAMRLNDTVNYAKANGFDYFATTLTVSPYKNAPLINSIGESLATADTLWLPTDFKKRNGYLQSVQLCARYDIYRQHYCGCAFSQQEE